MSGKSDKGELTWPSFVTIHFRRTLRQQVSLLTMEIGGGIGAKADLMLARYPANVREQTTDLLWVLAAKPGDAVTEFGRASLGQWRAQSKVETL